jgi:hypothetical protein
MKITKNIGVILLAIWLILRGLISLLGLEFAGLGLIMGILAIAAGVLLLIGRGSLSGKWAVIVLAVWLILTGLFALIDLSFSGSGILMGILAIAAGILLLIQR